MTVYQAVALSHWSFLINPKSAFTEHACTFSILQDTQSWESASANAFFQCWPLSSFSGAIGIILNPSPHNWLHLN